MFGVSQCCFWKAEQLFSLISLYLCTRKSTTTTNRFIFLSLHRSPKNSLITNPNFYSSTHTFSTLFSSSLINDFRVFANLLFLHGPTLPLRCMTWVSEETVVSQIPLIRIRLPSRSYRRSPELEPSPQTRRNWRTKRDVITDDGEGRDEKLKERE